MDRKYAAEVIRIWGLQSLVLEIADGLGELQKEVASGSASTNKRKPKRSTVSRKRTASAVR